MYTALLHGLQRPNAATAVAHSRPALCVRLGLAQRWQSSEPEVELADEENDADASASFTNDSLAPRGRKPAIAGNRDARSQRSALPRSTQLPWTGVDTSRKPGSRANGKHSIPSPTVSRSGAADAHGDVSSRLTWNRRGDVAQAAASGDRKAGEPLGQGSRNSTQAATSTTAASLPRPSRSPAAPASFTRSRPSRQDNVAFKRRSGEAEVRLPWERVMDGLTSAGRNKGNTDTSQGVGRVDAANEHSGRLDHLTKDSRRSGLPGQGPGFGASSKQRPRGQESLGPAPPPGTEMSWERRRVAGQQQSTVQPAAPLPWENLPARKPARSPAADEQRDLVDEMVGGSRYGGSPAAHRGRQGAPRRRKQVKVVDKEVQISAIPIPVRDLAVAMSKKTQDVMRTLRQFGEGRVSPETMVDPDTAELVALEFGLRTRRLQLKGSELGRTTVTKESFARLTPRPPVVSVMGHVDHGKTTLLDALRTSKVAGTEAAGITQKIGAFSVEVNESSVTFFDTPGHAAFKSMRHSTSKLTDIVLVVIAADDGVKSQTLEVLKLLNEFPNLTPVVAVTKIDRYGVDVEKAVDKISRQLLEHSIITEDYGGQVPIVPVSAVTREGFDQLLETLMLQAEVLELRADDKAPAEGVVVDSSVVRGKGGVADVLVSWGKLRLGDVIVAGTEYGKVRSLLSSSGGRLKEAGAAEPVRVVGMKGLPKMGDELLVVESESKARTITSARQKQLELDILEQQAKSLGAKRVSEEAAKRLKVEAQQAVRRRETALYQAREAVRTMKSRRDDSSKQAAKLAEEAATKAMEKAEVALRRAETQGDEAEQGSPKCFALFKAEGFGQLEAMSQVVGEIPQDEVEFSLVKSGLGPVTQSDVEAAALANAPIFAFSVGNTPPDVKAMAQAEGVQIHTHDVIYRFLESVKGIMSEFLPPEKAETVVGEAKTLEVFDTRGRNKENVKVAGLSVSSGKLRRDQLFRVVRNDDVVADGLEAVSMRHFKERVNEITKDKECGLVLQDFADFQVGDVVQCYTVEEVKRSV